MHDCDPADREDQSLADVYFNYHNVLISSGCSTCSRKPPSSPSSTRTVVFDYSYVTIYTAVCTG